jgi:large subunit ribosomal protein L24e
MKGNKAKQLEAHRKLVAQNQHLLPPQYRDQVEELLQEVEPQKEEDVLELEEQERLQPSKEKLRAKRKQRLVRGQGVEEMDVDE